MLETPHKAAGSAGAPRAVLWPWWVPQVWQHGELATLLLLSAPRRAKMHPVLPTGLSHPSDFILVLLRVEFGLLQTVWIRSIWYAETGGNTQPLFSFFKWKTGGEKDFIFNNIVTPKCVWEPSSFQEESFLEKIAQVWKAWAWGGRPSWLRIGVFPWNEVSPSA